MKAELQPAEPEPRSHPPPSQPQQFPATFLSCFCLPGCGLLRRYVLGQTEFFLVSGYRLCSMPFDRYNYTTVTLNRISQGRTRDEWVRNNRSSQSSGMSRSRSGEAISKAKSFEPCLSRRCATAPAGQLRVDCHGSSSASSDGKTGAGECPIKKGWMTKRSKWIKHWNRRFVVVSKGGSSSSGRLEWFENKQNPETNAAQKGSLELGDYSMRLQSSATNSTVRLVLERRSRAVLRGESVIVFEVASTSEANSWAEARFNLTDCAPCQLASVAKRKI